MGRGDLRDFLKVKNVECAALCDVDESQIAKAAKEILEPALAAAPSLKTSDFRILTRTRSLAHPTQRADVIFESIAAMIDKEADGRTYRLIGVGMGDLGEASAADPTDLFGFATAGKASLSR